MQIINFSNEEREVGFDRVSERTWLAKAEFEYKHGTIKYLANSLSKATQGIVNISFGNNEVLVERATYRITVEFPNQELESEFILRHNSIVIDLRKIND